MRGYIGVVCCLLLLFNGAQATSSASASVSVSSSSGPGGSSISTHHESTAVGPAATAITGSSGTAITEHSAAAVDQQSISNSNAGHTDAKVGTDAHTIGAGSVHSTGDALAINDYSDAGAQQEVAVESDYDGESVAKIGTAVSANPHGAEAEIVNEAASTGTGHAIATNAVTGGNYDGHLSAKHHVAAISDAGGAAASHSSLRAGFDRHHGSRLKSLLSGITDNGGRVIAGNHGYAAGRHGASAGASNLHVESHPRRTWWGPRRSSFGMIHGGTYGGVDNAESHAGADGEVIKDGTVAATAEFGSHGGYYRRDSVKASLVLDAEDR